MGFVIDLKPFANRRKRKEQEYERQQKVLDMRASLEERGLAPEEANAAVQSWVKTGEWNVPTERTVPGKMEPGPDGLMAYGPAQPIRQPIRLGKRDDLEMPYQVGEDGKVVKPQVDESFLSTMDSEGYRVKPKFQVRTQRKADTQETQDGEDIIIDAEGKEIRRVKNKTKQNRIHRLPTPPRSPAEETDPNKRAAYRTLEEYDQMAAKGEISTELESRAVAAARLVGLPVEKVTGEEPGWFGRMIGNKAESYERPTYGQGTGNAGADAARRQRAEQYLKTYGAKVTPANIKAILDRGLVK